MGSSSIFFAALVVGEFYTLRYGWDCYLATQTLIKLFKKMCQTDPLWYNNSQNMQRFENSIRSIVKNIGSERAEPCQQYLAYFVTFRPFFVLVTWTCQIWMCQHLKNWRGSHCLSSATPIGLKRPEIRQIAVLHSNSPVVIRLTPLNVGNKFPVVVWTECK